MAAVTPTKEPTNITAGDTAKWTRTLSDYPASDGWVLSYAFLREGDGLPVTFTATASGSNHLVNVDAGTTTQWMAGDYNGQGYVTKAGERYRVWQGRLTILPDYVSAGAIDTRTRAKRILDFIDGSFEKMSKKQTVSAVIEGVQLTFRNLDEFTRLRNYWANIVGAEQARQAGRARGAILARFSNPQ